MCLLVERLISFRFPAQQKVGGNSKIPSIVYYDPKGDVCAVGAEATDEAFLEQVDDKGYVKVEWQANL